MRLKSYTSNIVIRLFDQIESLFEFNLCKTDWCDLLQSVFQIRHVMYCCKVLRYEQHTQQGSVGLIYKHSETRLAFEKA